MTPSAETIYKRVLLVNSSFLPSGLMMPLPDTLVIFADPERLGDSLYCRDIAKQCGEGLSVLAPRDLIEAYKGDAFSGLQGLLGARLTSIPVNVSDIEKNPSGLQMILEAKDRQVEADDAEINRKLQEMQEAEKRAAKVEAPPLNELLDCISAFISDYVVFANEYQLAAVALWTLHTHVFNQFDVSPILGISAPDKACGKSRLLDCLARLVRKPWPSITPTEAVTFRKIEAVEPTMLIDEIDTVFNVRTANQHEGLRALLNAGHRKGTTVPRCVGQKQELKDFPTFCPKALAGIGELPDTVRDRSIAIRLARKTKLETVKKFRFRVAEETAAPIRKQIEAWAAQAHFDGYPALPDGLSDRAEDSWEPLLSIADAAGGKWPELARMAALSLSADVEPDDDSLGIRLLADCQAIFVQIGEDRITLVELLDRLNGLEESPWNDFGYTTRKLASMLRRYGVKSGTHRFEDKTAKGYLKSDFKDAWNRYSPYNTDFSGNIGNNGLTMRVSSQNLSVTEGQMLPNKNSRKPADRTDVTDVTEKTPYIRAEEEKQTPAQPALTFEEQTGIMV